MKKGRMSDFKELFEGKLTNQKINILLDELRGQNVIFFDGKQKSKTAFWKVTKSDT